MRGLVHPRTAFVHAVYGICSGGQLLGHILLVAVLGTEETVGFNCVTLFHVTF